MNAIAFGVKCFTLGILSIITCFLLNILLFVANYIWIKNNLKSEDANSNMEQDLQALFSKGPIKARVSIFCLALVSAILDFINKVAFWIFEFSIIYLIIAAIAHLFANL